MLKKYHRDLRFAFNALLLALVIMAVLQAVAPFLKSPDPRQQEIDAYRQRIVPLPASDVAYMLTPRDGKPVLLVLYASWCSYCRQTMPGVVDLLKNGRLDKVSPLFISLDYRAGDMASYLVHSGFTGFTPYLLGRGDMKEVLNQAGSGYRGQIPYIALFDQEGHRTREFFGSVNQAVILDAIPN